MMVLSCALCCRCCVVLCCVVLCCDVLYCVVLCFYSILTPSPKDKLKQMQFSAYTHEELIKIAEYRASFTKEFWPTPLFDAHAIPLTAHNVAKGNPSYPPSSSSPILILVFWVYRLW